MYLLGLLVSFHNDFALTLFQLYRNLEAGDTQSLKLQLRDLGLNPGRLAPQALGAKPPHPLPALAVNKNFD